eukprot:TRINITY_DN10266_c0_g1_i6.p1 TRINITY_DN10266_c0_g1~~TRINITY_DN10266_c0_g1_i6.p1  ORF type:complete len:477 (+),score=99.93 TRINITY_DN10266_c0_g1_i6:197-1627(+)
MSGNEWELIGCILVLMLCVVTKHRWPQLKHSRYIHEASALLVVGIICGFVLWLAEADFAFSQSLFWDWVLPPIIFNAGYAMKRRNFFKHFGVISLLGVFATVGSTLIFSFLMFGLRGLFPSGGLGDTVAPYLVYGAVMTATDSVAVLAILDPQRQEKAHAVVFGEGVLNDAITIVLFKTFVDKQSDSWGSEAVFGVTLSFVWLLLASTAVGIFTGAICCISIRKCSLGEADPHLELLMTALFAWLSYILAEVFGLSAIMSAFVCGIMLSHYNHYNMAKEAAGAFSIVSHALSEGAEAITFFYIGVTLLAGGTIKDPYFDFSFIFFTIFCLTLARGISVGTVLSLSSVTFLPRPFGSRQGLVTWFAGLVRGVVAFALALTLQAKQEDVGMTSDQSRLAVTSTAVVVIFTTIVFGSCSFLFLQWVGDDEAPPDLSLIHISEPTRLLSISYAVFCLKKKKKKNKKQEQVMYVTCVITRI